MQVVRVFSMQGDFANAKPALTRIKLPGAPLAAGFWDNLSSAPHQPVGVGACCESASQHGTHDFMLATAVPGSGRPAECTTHVPQIHGREAAQAACTAPCTNAVASTGGEAALASMTRTKEVAVFVGRREVARVQPNGIENYQARLAAFALTAACGCSRRCMLWNGVRQCAATCCASSPILRHVNVNPACACKLRSAVAVFHSDHAKRACFAMRLLLARIVSQAHALDPLGAVTSKWVTAVSLRVQVALSRDGRFLAAATWGSDVKVWELCFDRDGSFARCDRAMDLKGHTSGVHSVAFNGASSRAVTASKDGSLRIWRIDVRYRQQEDPKCILKAKLSGQPYAHLAWCCNDTIVGTDGCALHFISAQTGKVFERVDDAHPGRISCLVVTSAPVQAGQVTEAVVVSGSVDGRARVWVVPQSP